MGFTMELFGDLAAHVPCEELTFKPERSVLDSLKRLSSNEPEALSLLICHHSSNYRDFLSVTPYP
jgi:hypothetical protein